MGRSRGLVNLVCEYNQALSDPQRVKMLKIIGSSSAKSVCVGDFANILGISQPSATKHLKILYNVDLVTRKRVGTNVYYSLNLEMIDEYHKLLEEAFVKGFTPCPYGFKCEECPEKDLCA